jgi:hypothetical protein
MISGRIGCELTVLAVLSILSIFLFPAVQGPYCVVHGPATALQAARSALRVRIAIIQAALNSYSLISAFVVLSWMSLSTTGFQSPAVLQSRGILRC